MKPQYTEKISTLESQLTRLYYDVDNVQNLIIKEISKTIELKMALNSGSLSEIRSEVGSIYPEKIFEGSKIRTARRNDFIQHINLINNNFSPCRGSFDLLGLFCWSGWQECVEKAVTLKSLPYKDGELKENI